MTNCKLVSTRVCKATILHKKLCSTNKIEIKEIENSPYTQAVGILIMQLPVLDLIYHMQWEFLVGINQI